MEWKGKTHTLNHSSSLLHPSLGHSHRNHLAESRGLPSTSRPRSPGNRKFVRGNCQRKKTLLCMHQMAAIATLGPSTPPTPRAIKTNIVTKYCRKPTVPYVYKLIYCSVEGEGEARGRRRSRPVSLSAEDEETGLCHSTTTSTKK